MCRILNSGDYNFRGLAVIRIRRFLPESYIISYFQVDKNCSIISINFNSINNPHYFENLKIFVSILYTVLVVLGLHFDNIQ